MEKIFCKAYFSWGLNLHLLEEKNHTQNKMNVLKSTRFAVKLRKG